ncbi:MAG: DUF4258 domain-containing protein [Methylococcales bacterium]
MSNAVFSWSEEKNALLKAERNICFEDILMALQNGNLLEIIPNPSANHPEQKCLVVNINDYAYLVPYVESNEEIFLKTIYPSRKYSKLLRKGKTNEK